MLLPARTARRLALLIARLARRCGTAPFIPHVTLLGGIVLSRKVAIERTTALARVLWPFPVRLRGLGHEAVLYRCLYLRAAGPGLRPARARSLRLIGSDSRQRGAGAGSDRFRPHLSLVYGRLAYAERRRLTREIEGTFNVTFTARRIALVRTSGDHTTWRVVAVRRLRS